VKLKFSDVFEFVPLLNEILDTEFTSITWEQDGSKITGDAFLGDLEFKIYIEPQNLRLKGSVVTWLNVAFIRIVDGQPVERSLGLHSDASRVIGAVINALKT
jgi:hypothetical protein